MSQRRVLSGLSAEHVLGALSSLSGAFWLRSDSGVFAGALPSGQSSDLDPEPSLSPALSPASAGADPFPRWVGAIPYEAVRVWERGPAADARARPLMEQPIWQRYDAVVRFDPAEAPQLLAADEAAAERLESAIRSRLAPLSPAAASLAWAEPPEPESVHEARIVRALELISRGQLYQVNLARRFAFERAGHPFELLLRLSGHRRAASLDSALAGDMAPYAAAIDFGAVAVVSTSPESFLELRAGGFVATRPIKGTRPRHTDPARDRALAAELDQSEKERAELAMVIDIERNDLGRLALAGSVTLAEPPQVVSLATVHHRQALVTARVPATVSRSDLLRALMPSGSVTGAPKVRAMEVIRELEAHRRGLYTGALGILNSDGSLELSMAIRCLVMASGRAEYFSGGGIVADSDPAAEVQETLWKAEQLLALLGERGLSP